ncbi:DNA cytosine methyltransferase [Senegalia sp. (in: firmicutes)]|uniref:DNA cytosine methyltransferase n=1 Tax=Senegalia sp. (in: firmicutes) TaxID=1924098 RepID=UPI003F98CD80
MKKQDQLLLFEEEKNTDFIDVNNIDLHSEEKLNVVSLFSGCGGMDLGFTGGFEVFNKKFEENPYKIIFANDIDKFACETYTENFDHKAVNEDLKKVKFEEEITDNVDVVIGGFPCQDFSHAGNRQGTQTERGRLYKEMKKVVSKYKPKAFVAENVDGLRTMKSSTRTSQLDIIIDEFREVGYQVVYKVLNSADYGVPQTRVRIIIIGIRNDIYNQKIYYPEPTHSKESNTKPWMTAKQGIDDLWERLDQTDINKHSSKDYSKAKFYEGKKTQGNRKIDSDKPAMTVRAEHHGNIEAHYRTLIPEEPENMKGWRRLSVRECARLQSFPDDFIFSCSASQAYRQVGNAVPPILGWNIARSLYFTLFN